MNIFPSYKCNMLCKFCALCRLEGELIDLDWLETQFENHEELCGEINILGGEPSILPTEYQKRLIEICTKAADEKPYYITNLLKVNEDILDKVNLIVSYDFELRPFHKRVLNNILSLEQEYSLSTIMTDTLIDRGAEKFLNFIDHLTNCKRVDLALYRSGTTEYDNTPDHDKLMIFVKRVMDHPKINLDPYSAMKKEIDNSFDNIRAYIGILPGNKFGLRTDYNHIGYIPYNTFEEAIDYFNKRKNHISNTEPCKSCRYTGTCWAPGGYEDGVCHGDKEMMDMFREAL